MGLDKEGNETTYVNVARKTAENGWKTPYRVSEDQTEIPQQVDAQDVTEDNVPDWVNEQPARQEPSDSEW